MFHLYLQDVLITQHKDTEGAEKAKKSLPPSIPEHLEFKIPSWIHKWLLLRSWTNQLEVHVLRCSLRNENISEDVAAHLDYIRLHSRFDNNTSRYRFSVSTIDAFLSNKESHLTKGGNLIKIFKNLSVVLEFSLNFACCVYERNKMVVNISDASLLVSLASPFVTPVLGLAKKEPQPESKETYDTSNEIPKLEQIVKAAAVISSVELRVENAKFAHRDIVLEMSSMLLSLKRNRSYKLNTVAEASAYVNSLRAFSQETKCLDVPSLTYLFECDLSDLFRAYKSGDQHNFLLDISTSLDVTHPSLDVYFDQLGSFARMFKLSKSKSKHTAKKEQKPFLPVPLSKYLRKLRAVSARFSVSDIRATLHLPAMDLNNFVRSSIHNVTATATATSFITKYSTKELGKILRLNPSPNDPPSSLKAYTKLKNFNVDIEENQATASKIDVMIAYCLNSHKIKIRASSRRMEIKSVNSMIFYVVRRLRDSHIKHYNEMCKNVKRSDSLASEIEQSSSEVDYIDFLEVLPESIAVFSVRATEINGTIICKEGLPSHKLYNENAGEEIDLGKFRRGVAITISDYKLDFNRSQRHFQSGCKAVEVFVLSEYAALVSQSNEDDLYKEKKREIDFSDLLSIESFEADRSEDEQNVSKQRRVLIINDINIQNDYKRTDKLILTVPEADGKLDMFLIWCVFYARSLLKQFSPTVKFEYSQADLQHVKVRKKKLKLDVHVQSIAIKVLLPNDVDTLLELDTLDVTDASNSPAFNLENCRLYVVHPATKAWTRLISIHQTHSTLGELLQETCLLKSSSVKIYVPFRYLIYTVIDNIITMVKAVRQVRHNFQQLSEGIHEFDRLMPQAKPAIIFPKIRWRSKKFNLSLEDDVFETELGIIFELGRLEQVAREKKWLQFEEEAKNLRSKVQIPSTDLDRTSSVDRRRFLSERKPSKRGQLHHANNLQKNIASTFRHGFSRHLDRGSTTDFLANDSDTPSTTPDVSVFTKEDAEAEIKLARERLLEEISVSWVRNFSKLKQAKFAKARKFKTKLGGYDRISPLMGEKYDIQKLAPGAPIMSVVIDGFDLALEKAQIDDIDDFLYTYGKGQPKLEYSILVPLFVRLRATSFHISLKDYPLPVLFFPPAEDPEATVMDLKGNLVINEKLVHRKEEMRHIYVPFTAATLKESFIDNFYSVYVPRTLTPVKSMFDLTCSVNTEKACILNWSKSYQSAFLSAAGALDNFTKPQIDDSPIGWWDKLALIMHGKLRFDFSNELCLQIKSSADPYKIVGRDAGFMWSWKNGVELKFNYTGNQKELVMLDSYDFVFGVPDCSYAIGLPWSSQDAEEELLADALEEKTFQKKVMSFSSDEKVRWRLGLLFERNEDVKCREVSADNKRTNEFIPHYDVVVTSPEFNWHPDSYEGFRSDYLHCSIGVTSVSKKGNSHNTAYLSPVAFQYFFHWWHTISNTVVLPVRLGKLFPANANKASVKMGIHLVTFKYQLILEPLTVSHMYTSYENLEEGPHVIVTGLKGKSTKCHIDLHQRKEVIRYINEKLDIDKKVHHMKLHLGEITVTDADIRAIKATFKDPSIRGYVIANFTNQLGESLDVEKYYEELAMRAENIRSSNWIHGVDCSDEEFAWLDQNDFVELEQTEELSADPTISVLPFFHTPRFTYFREFTLERQDHRYPFGREPSHNCVIGGDSPERVQAELLRKRVEILKQEINDNRNALQDLHNSDDPSKHAHVERLQRDISEVEQRFDVVNEIYQDATTPKTLEDEECSLEGKDEGDVHDYHAEGEIKRRMSNTLSVYSSYRSIDQAMEMTSENSEVSEFHNRFLFHNVRLKWNNKVREIITAYMFLIGSRRTETLMMSRRAIDLIETFIQKRKEEAFQKPPKEEDEKFDQTFHNCGDVIEDFENYLNTLASENNEMEYNYLIKLISPQFQLECEADPDSSMSVTSEDIEMRVLSEQIAGTDDIIGDSNNGEVYTVESKHGVLFKNMQAFSFSREKFPETSNNPYGEVSRKPTWPPWIDFEVCVDPSWLKDDLVLEKTSMALMVKKPNLLSMDHNAKLNSDELTVHLAKVVVTATSKQYSSMYYILLNLLLDGKSAKEQLHQRFDRIIEFSSLDDTDGLAEKVQLLQSNINICKHTLLAVADKKLTPEERKSKAHIELALDRLFVQLAMITYSLRSASSQRKGNRGVLKNWSINADQVIWHLVQNSNEPLVDIALAPSKFQRMDMIDGSNSNLVEISMMQGFNLRQHAAYADLMLPLMKEYNAKEPVISMKWKMLNRVGGIRIMRNAWLKCQSASIQLDYDSAQLLLAYLFPKDDKPTNGHPRRRTSSLARNHSGASDIEDVDSADSSGNQSKAGTNSINAIRKMIARKAVNGSPASSTTSILTNRRSTAEDSSSIDNNSYSQISTSDIPSLNSETRAALGLGKKRHKKEDKVDDLSLIMKRSSKFFVIDEIELAPINLRVSFKAPKHLNIIDVHRLLLKIPSLHFTQKTWSGEDFVLQLKKEIIKVILSHSGKIIGNKFKYRDRKANKEPLKQITDYTRYILLAEIEGRSFGEGSSSGEEDDDSTPLHSHVSPSHSFTQPNFKSRIKSTLKLAVH